MRRKPSKKLERKVAFLFVFQRASRIVLSLSLSLSLSHKLLFSLSSHNTLLVCIAPSPKAFTAHAISFTVIRYAKFLSLG
jgi:hypothetical protein